MRSLPPLPILRLLPGLLTGFVVSTATAGGSPLEVTTVREDTIRTRFVDAADGLLESTPGSTPELILSRARGHLASLSGAVDADALRTIRTPRARLAWLEAAMASQGLAAGERPEQARSATRRALDLLASTHPEDPSIVLDRRVASIESAPGDVVDLSGLTPKDLGHRPFATSPDAICDRLVASRGIPAAIAMLDLADAATLPQVVACVLASDLDADNAVAARLAPLDHGLTGIGPTVILELARRNAGRAVARYATAHPESVTLPGVRTAAIAAVAAADPDAAIALAGSVDVLDRLPGAGRIAVRTALARWFAASDPDAAWDHANAAGQLDDRIIAFMAARGPDADPDRMLDDVKSLRTVAPGRLVADLMQRRVDRETVVESVADLFRTGRHDLAYTLLIPNTTEPNRPADQWMPTRITLLADALVRAEASPDAFIPLLESVSRIHGVDAQIESLAAIATALSTLDATSDLPEPLRAVLGDVLVAIALRG
jgi:hypothetical protein